MFTRCMDTRGRVWWWIRRKRTSPQTLQRLLYPPIHTHKKLCRRHQGCKTFLKNFTKRKKTKKRKQLIKQKATKKR